MKISDILGKNPELVIFDMDGLLFNSEELFMRKKGEVMAGFGYPNQRREDYIRTLGLAGASLNARLAEIYGPDYPADEISRCTREAVRRHLEEYGPEIKPGIRELLESLRKAGIACCVGSSSPVPEIENYVEKAGLSGYFEFSVGCDLVAASKPEPDIFLECCRRAQVSPDEALVLEDSQSGILAASRAGIPVICIPDMQEPGAGIAELTDFIAESAAELEI